MLSKNTGEEEGGRRRKRRRRKRRRRKRRRRKFTLFRYRFEAEPADAHVCAALLISWLEELPAPLFGKRRRSRRRRRRRGGGEAEGYGGGGGRGLIDFIFIVAKAGYNALMDAGSVIKDDEMVIDLLLPPPPPLLISSSTFSSRLVSSYGSGCSGTIRFCSSSIFINLPPPPPPPPLIFLLLYRLH